jgi:hypothetical protein
MTGFSVGYCVPSVTSWLAMAGGIGLLDFELGVEVDLLTLSRVLLRACDSSARRSRRRCRVRMRILTRPIGGAALAEWFLAHARSRSHARTCCVPSAHRAPALANSFMTRPKTLMAVLANHRSTVEGATSSAHGQVIQLLRQGPPILSSNDLEHRTAATWLGLIGCVLGLQHHSLPRPHRPRAPPMHDLQHRRVEDARGALDAVPLQDEVAHVLAGVKLRFAGTRQRSMSSCMFHDLV